jgi:hydrogenase maturation protease
MMGGRLLLVGIGSPHGDDRAGWLVADAVAADPPLGLQVRCANHPAELLDWLDNIDTLMVCDAIVCDWPPGTWQKWAWPAAEIEMARCSGSHQLSLADTLALADELGRLPAHVELWVISITSARPMQEVTSAVAAAVPEIARQIVGERCHA